LQKYGWTPLHSAADKGHDKVAEVLLRAGADVNAADKV
jgi:ankyrin repeat protein